MPDIWRQSNPWGATCSISTLATLALVTMNASAPAGIAVSGAALTTATAIKGARPGTRPRDRDQHDCEMTTAETDLTVIETMKVGRGCALIASDSRLFLLMGVRAMVIRTAVGILNVCFPVGTLVVIYDHVNLLLGEKADGGIRGTDSYA